MITSKLEELGGTIITTDGIEAVSDSSFYFPLLVGGILLLISIILALIIRKHWFVIVLMGLFIAALTIPLSIFVSINSFERVGTSYLFILKDDSNIANAYSLFDKVERVGDHRFMGYDYYQEYEYLKDRNDPFKSEE